MGEHTERDERTFGSASLLGLLRRWYHVPLLVVAMAFMFWVRVQSYDDFVFADGAVRLRAVDSWYHWRTTMYTVNNWPYTMPYDPWTAFPTGTYVGQFGTLFDQLLATVALLVGLGDPSKQTVFAVVLLAIPALAALIALPTYAIGRRLGGRPGGLVAVALLALFPGLFLTRTTSGMLQHHVAEVLFMSLAILATMVALRVAERERPTYDRVIEREYERLARPAGYSVLAGLAIALYIWVWPPGVVLIGILGLFFLIELSVVTAGGKPPDHLAFVGAVALGTTGVLTLATMEVTTVNATDPSLLQPLLAFAVAGGCLFMTWLARQWVSRRIDSRSYPVAVACVIVVSMATVALIAPHLWNTIAGNVYGRVIPFGYSATALTVPEVQPPDDLPRYVYSQYGLAFYTALIGLVALVGRSVFTDDHRAEHGLIVVWALFLTSMAFTQVRFNYYYVIPIAVLNAYLVGLILERADLSVGLDSVRHARSSGFVGVVLVAALLLALFVPLVPPVADTTVVEAGQTASPSRDAMFWKSSNTWLAENSPAPGEWGGADNADDLEYYGTYSIPEDRDFAYPEGAYGVMSWWDYGHIITVQAERIPHANPFQQNAQSAAAFLTADSEQRGELVLAALPAAEGEDPLHSLENEELAAVADERTAQQEGEEIRYVMISSEMVGHKFSAIATYTGVDNDAYWDRQQVLTDDGEIITAPARNDAYEDTMLSRLYYDDADGMEHYRLVHDDNQTTRFASVAVSHDGGESWQPRFVNREMTPGVERSVAELRADPDVEVAVYDERVQPSVKTYERVEGAELTGSVDAPEGSTVTAELELTAEESGRTFTYEQTARVENGEFTMTVPYATEQDRSVEEGYTDSSVAADGPYEISVAETETETEIENGIGDESEAVGTAEVPESAIYDGERVEV
ncbi:oligosaccharyl transferase, archaeosortase A system-associated [Halalkalicoccus sp. GCM10025322]|uniref:oligosaccharyl transferase, archaeosortase A system-associated n=1 Tax=Halalkalicoccus TaxID=332246 RepID=UPI002F962A86